MGIQIVMRLETYENEATQSTHVKAKTNKNQGSWVAASHMLEQVCVRMSSSCVPQARSCVRRSLPRKPNLHTNKAEAKQNIKRKI